MKETAALSIKAATALTTAYTGWASSWVDAGEGYTARLFLDIVKGTATTIELKLEYGDTSYDGTETGYETWAVDGTGAADLDEVQITAADLGTTHKVALQIDVADVRGFRLLAKRTGGDANTTLACAVTMGRYE